MAVAPDKLLRKSLVKEVDAIEKVIDKHLKKRKLNDDGSVNIATFIKIMPYHEEELNRRYTAVGWKKVLVNNRIGCYSFVVLRT